MDEEDQKPDLLKQLRNCCTQRVDPGHRSRDRKLRVERGGESCNFTGINDGAVDDSVRLWADDILSSHSTLGVPLFYNFLGVWGGNLAGI